MPHYQTDREDKEDKEFKSSPASYMYMIACIAFSVRVK